MRGQRPISQRETGTAAYLTLTKAIEINPHMDQAITIEGKPGPIRETGWSINDYSKAIEINPRLSAAI